MDYTAGREQARVWRNVNRLTHSWVVSLLNEAEKSKQFAEVKTKKSLNSVVLSAREFSLPKKVSVKNSIKESGQNVVPELQQMTRDSFHTF